MGARTALLMYTDGDVGPALRDAVEPDRAATGALVARLLPGLDVTATDDGTLEQGLYPTGGIVYAGVFPGLTVVCAPELIELRPTDLRPGWLAEGAGRRVILHSMHSVADFLAFAVWRPDGALERALCLSPDLGVVDDRGDRLPFETAYCAGRRPADDDDDEPSYPLPFHPLDLGEAALWALCGFVLEGVPGMPVERMPDLDRVTLAGFRPGRPTLTLERSRGPAIAQPTAFEVESQVRRLGDGLEFVVVDRGDEHYLQAAVGFGESGEKFDVERREGGADRHFRCGVGTVEEVADIFRGYLVNPDDRGHRTWTRVRV